MKLDKNCSYHAIAFGEGFHLGTHIYTIEYKKGWFVNEGNGIAIDENSELEEIGSALVFKTQYYAVVLFEDGSTAHMVNKFINLYREILKNIL